MSEKFRDMLGASSMILMMVAVIILGLGIKNILTVLPASAYEDKGVHTFTRRMHPTTTVYKVRYEATDGSGYRCSFEAGSTETSAQLLAEKGDIVQRVLYIHDEDAIVVVDPDESAESYAAGERQRYLLMILIPGLFLAVCAVVFAVKKIR